jgi:hypothetical protein
MKFETGLLPLFFEWWVEGDLADRMPTVQKASRMGMAPAMRLLPAIQRTIEPFRELGSKLPTGS